MVEPLSGIETLVGARELDAILTGRVTVSLGAKKYALADLPNGPNRRWLEGLDGVWRGLMTALESVEDGDWTGILGAIAPRSYELLEMIVAYDRGVGRDGAPIRPGVLPPIEELDETATPKEILLAAVGVWQAANPLAVTAIAGTLDVLTGGIPSGATNSSPSVGDSASTTSRTSSPPGRPSRSTSTRPRTD